MNRLFAVQPVRCLSCSFEYAKPARGGTAAANPGCPRCGYVGWVDVDERITVGATPLRSAVGRLRRRSSRSG
jgi:hypothetical protein